MHARKIRDFCQTYLRQAMNARHPYGSRFAQKSTNPGKWRSNYVNNVGLKLKFSYFLIYTIHYVKY